MFIGWALTSHCLWLWYECGMKYSCVGNKFHVKWIHNIILWWSIPCPSSMHGVILCPTTVTSLYKVLYRSQLHCWVCSYQMHTWSHYCPPENWLHEKLFASSTRILGYNIHVHWPLISQHHHKCTSAMVSSNGRMDNLLLNILTENCT